MRRRRIAHDDDVRARVRPGPVRVAAAAGGHPVLTLQRAIGNRAVARAISEGRITGGAIQRDANDELAAKVNPWLASAATTQFAENYAELAKLMAAMHQLSSLSHVPAMHSLTGLSEGLAREITARPKVVDRVMLFSAIVSGVSSGVEVVKLELPAADQQHTSPGANQVSDAGELARESVELLKHPTPVPAADPRAFLEAQKLQITLLLTVIEQLVKSANSSTPQGGNPQSGSTDASASATTPPTSAA